MIDLTHYTVEAKAPWINGDPQNIDASCDRCPDWCLPEPERAEIPLADLIALLQDHEREAHPT